MKTMTVKELKQKLINHEVCLIDVREQWEYNLQNIEGAHHIPLKEFSLKNIPSLSKPIVIYCAVGIRSAHACDHLLKENPSLEVYNLIGGIHAWCHETIN